MVHRDKTMSKKDVQTTLVFAISKLYLIEISKWPQYFVFQIYIKEARRSYISLPLKLDKKPIVTTSIFRPLKLEKSRSKWRRFFAYWNVVENVCWNNNNFLPIGVMSNKVRQNNVNFLSIEMTLKIVHRNVVVFSLIEIRSMISSSISISSSITT